MKCTRYKVYEKKLLKKYIVAIFENTTKTWFCYCFEANNKKELKERIYKDEHSNNSIGRLIIKKVSKLTDGTIII